jgi:hypothetical protein
MIGAAIALITGSALVFWKLFGWGYGKQIDALQAEINARKAEVDSSKSQVETANIKVEIITKLLEDAKERLDVSTKIQDKLEIKVHNLQERAQTGTVDDLITTSRSLVSELNQLRRAQTVVSDTLSISTVTTSLPYEQAARFLQSVGCEPRGVEPSPWWHHPAVGDFYIHVNSDGQVSELELRLIISDIARLN